MRNGQDEGTQPRRACPSWGSGYGATKWRRHVLRRPFAHRDSGL
jgi:hypothetical protein